MGSVDILSLERENETHKLMRIRDRATVTIRNEKQWIGPWGWNELGPENGPWGWNELGPENGSWGWNELGPENGS